jgi:hypothetical protein
MPGVFFQIDIFGFKASAIINDIDFHAVLLFPDAETDCFALSLVESVFHRVFGKNLDGKRRYQEIFCLDHVYDFQFPGSAHLFQ